MKSIRPWLLVGNYSDSQDTDTLLENGISRVLCLVPDMTQGENSNSSTPFPLLRMVVPLEDVEDENLLDNLESCIQFIELGKQKSEKVLVHCMAGISRSVSVIIAYLMKSEEMSFQDAFQSVKNVHGKASPNPGFVEQLQLFEKMGCRIDKDDMDYKQFRVKHIGQAYNERHEVEISKFAMDPADDLAHSKPATGKESPDLQPMIQQSIALYRCKKCRREIISPANVLSHQLGSTESFEYRKRNKPGGLGHNAEIKRCSSLFVEPMQWMATLNDGSIEGKLLCPKCSSRIGSFNWYGIQCSCGAWITPAFQLQTSKLDASWN